MLALFGLLAACGEAAPPAGSSAASGSGGQAGSADGGGGLGGAPAAPIAVRFFVDDRPHDPDNAEVEAAEVRWSDPVRIVVEGLAAAQRVRVEVSTKAWGVFIADAEGRVDLGRDAPDEGTWTGADVDGPFWSAPQAAAPIFDVDVSVFDEDTKAPLVEGSFRRRPVNEGVESVEVNDGARVGLVAWPKGMNEPLPAVLVFGGSEGGTWYGTFMAYYLAQLGYITFGVGYFGAPGLPSGLESVPLEILGADLDYLASLPGVDPTRIAVLGGSRGGELALLLGATFPDRVSAVVAQVPSGYVWGATTELNKPAWTFNGQDIPYVPSSGAWADVYQQNGKTYIVSTPAFVKDIAAAPASALAAATIPAGKAAGPVLLLGGADDKLWPSCSLGNVAWEELDASGHVALHGDERYCFLDAGHAIAYPPGSSTLDSTEIYDPSYNAYLVLGGTPAGNARAERAANNAIRAFFERALAR